MINIALLGPPGAGKGTQADLIRKRKGFQHFAVGDVLRDAAKKDAVLAAKLAAGEMASPEVIEEVAKAFFANVKGNVIIDGMPRSGYQIALLDRVLKHSNKKLNIVFFLDLEDEEIKERILNRWICRKDNGELEILSGSREALLDKCSGILERRKDDNFEALEKRLEVYRKETAPLIAEYEKRAILVKIDASKTKEEVYALIERHL